MDKTIEYSQLQDNGRFIKGLLTKNAALAALSLMIYYSLPLFCNMLVGLWYGGDGLAIVALYSPLLFLENFFGYVIVSGAAVLCAKAIARDNQLETNRIFSSAAVLLLITGILVFGGLLLFRGTVNALLIKDASLSSESYYIYIIVCSFCALLFNLPFQFARIVGKSKVSVLQSVVMVLASLILMVLLKPLLGIAAIALGQAIGTAISTVLCMFLIRKQLHLLIPPKLHVREIIVNGSPMGLPKLYIVISTAVLNSLFLGVGGAETVAVYGVISNLNRFIASLTSGISQAMLPLISVFNEEQDVTSIRQTVKVSYLNGNVTIAFICLILFLFRNTLSATFGLESHLFILPLVINGFYLILNLNAVLLATMYQATGRLVFANVVPFLQDFSILLLFAWIARDSVYGIWLAFPLSCTAGLLLLFVMLAVYRKANTHLVLPYLLDKRWDNDAKYISFSVEGNSAKVAQAAEKVHDFCRKQNIESKKSLLLSLAVEEILTLIVTHSENKSAVSFSVRIYLHEGEIIMRIRNGGVAFNPIEYYQKHITQIVEESVNLAGIKYVSECASDIYYRQTFGVNNMIVSILL